MRVGEKVTAAEIWSCPGLFILMYFIHKEYKPQVDDAIGTVYKMHDLGNIQTSLWHLRIKIRKWSPGNWTNRFMFMLCSIK